MAGFARLALGTVQFGQPYGVVDPARVAPEAVATILDAAWRGGIDMLDTAAAYGQAEELIGRLRPATACFAVVGKTAAIADQDYGAAAVERICDGVRASLRRLRIETLDALLVHQAQDLLAPGGTAYFRALERLRDDGCARRIGVSIYDAPTLRPVLAAYPVEIVQLPLNILDQRLLQDGTLAELSRRGVEVHARSVFLQGALLAEPASLPARFAPVRDRLDRLRAASKAAGLTLAALALGFAARCPGVSRLVIGVNTLSQLDQNLAAYRSARSAPAWTGAAAFAVADREIVDPRTWSS